MSEETNHRRQRRVVQRGELTLAPASARPRATSYPMPPAPPVIMTVRPSSRNCLNTLSWTGGFGALIEVLPFVPFEAMLPIGENGELRLPVQDSSTIFQVPNASILVIRRQKYIYVFPFLAIIFWCPHCRWVSPEWVRTVSSDDHKANNMLPQLWLVSRTRRSWYCISSSLL